MTTPAPTSPDWLRIDDAALLNHCRVDTYRASGPGGQKRNKTSSAVRITHLPTSLMAIAHESRSQHQNKASALKRLRHRMALNLRTQIDAENFSIPPWFSGLQLSHRHPDYLPTLSLVLDLLEIKNYSVSETARLLDLTTSRLVNFLQADETLLAHVNQQRKALSLRQLGSA